MRKFYILTLIFVLNIQLIEISKSSEIEHKWLLAQMPSGGTEWYIDLYNTSYNDDVRITYFTLLNYTEEKMSDNSSQIAKMELNCEPYNYWTQPIFVTTYSGKMGSGAAITDVVDGTKYQLKTPLTPNMGTYAMFVQLCDSAFIGRLPDIKEIIRKDQVVTNIRGEDLLETTYQSILITFWNNLLNPNYTLK